MAEFRDDLALKLVEYYQRNDRIPDFLNLARDYIADNPDSQYAGQMLFYLGSYWLRNDEIESLRLQFTDYIDRYNGTRVQEGALYWRGLANLFASDYAAAVEDFQRLRRDFENTQYAEDALYRSGVALFGDGRYEAAMEAFEQHAARYPRSNLRGESEFFLGDIHSLMGEMETAMEHYRSVEQYTNNLTFVERAYKQMSNILEANERWEDALKLWEDFLGRYREQIDPSDAIYRYGLAMEGLGRFQDMYDLYVEAVIEHGNNREAVGIDRILEAYPRTYHERREQLLTNIEFFERLLNDREFLGELVEDRSYMFSYFMSHPGLDESATQKLQNDLRFSQQLLEDPAPIRTWLNEYERRLQAYPEQTPVERLRPIYRRARGVEQLTLAYRLQMLLDKQGALEGASLVFTASDFEVASPATLLWMARKMRGVNVDIAKDALTRLVDNYPENDNVGPAMLLLGEIAQDAFQYDQAIARYEEVQERLPGEEIAARALARIGGIHVQNGEYEKAREVYTQILRTPAWRGEPQAEALYELGMLNFERGDYGKARAFFERVYIGHAFFSEWAASSYLMDARALVAQGNREDAASVIDEAREMVALRETQAWADIQNLYLQLR